MKKYLLMFLIPCFIWSCTNTTINDEAIEDIDLENDALEEVFYQVPSPNVFFSLINSDVISFKPSLILELKGNIISRINKEVFLGMYIADMAYLTTFDELSTSIKYFSKIKELSDEIGLSAVISENTLRKVENNANNVDSLKTITDNSFYDIVQALESGGNGKSLSIIMFGGWLESMYISLNLVEQFDVESKLVQRILSQKLSFNNISHNLKRFEKDDDIANLIKRLNAINNLFDNIERTIIESIENDEASDKNIIGNRSRWVCDKKTYDLIKTEIINLRNHFVKQN